MMIYWFSNLIPVFFYFLFFSVPLILYPYTSELFEFNKMVAVYIMTTLITTAWVIKSISNRKIIMRRTILDIPLLFFLATQFFSTVTSIDFRTSLLGYYSRYHGGLISSISYALLYWAFVSNMDLRKTKNTIQILFISTVLVCAYAILEHFGIDKNLWVQDVQNRVFSTLGQPNWLAAFIVALLPISWAYSIINKYSGFKNKYLNRFYYPAVSFIIYLTLLYTKSRSGVLAFGISSIVFWPAVFWIKRKKLSKITGPVFLIILPLFFLTIFVGTPWNQGLFAKVNKKEAPVIEETQTIAPRELDVQISPSGDIRKIVWQGALDVFKAYPILGSGVETFAYSYYNFRPASHNLLSEWDFLYNKAHNEYLNFLATTGVIGFAAYALLILFILIQLSPFKFHLSKKPRLDPKKASLFHLALFSGFLTILITNFFGFSVVPVGLLFFLFPAMEVSFLHTTYNRQQVNSTEIDTIQKVTVIFVVCTMFYVLFAIGKYWVADLNYAKGLAHASVGNLAESRNYFAKAVKLSPKEAVFWSDLSESTTLIAIELIKQGEQDTSTQYISSAVNEMQHAETLSPKDVNIKRKDAGNYIKLSVLSDSFLNDARRELESAISLAPTDAKLYYNLGLVIAKQGDIDQAMEIFDKTIEMKSNYRNAHLAKALLLIDKGNLIEAKNELEYILEKIDPNDKTTIQQLEEINN